MSYNQVAEETVRTKRSTTTYRIYRCSHCRAWLVLPGAFASVPKMCAKCKR